MISVTYSGVLHSRTDLQSPFRAGTICLFCYVSCFVKFEKWCVKINLSFKTLATDASRWNPHSSSVEINPHCLAESSFQISGQLQSAKSMPTFEGTWLSEGLVVQILMDNTTVRYYIDRQGSTNLLLGLYNLELVCSTLRNPYCYSSSQQLG